MWLLKQETHAMVIEQARSSQIQCQKTMRNANESIPGDDGVRLFGILPARQKHVYLLKCHPSVMA
jgi:hypothetical protein